MRENSETLVLYEQYQGSATQGQLTNQSSIVSATTSAVHNIVGSCNSYNQNLHLNHHINPAQLITTSTTGETNCSSSNSFLTPDYNFNQQDQNLKNQINFTVSNTSMKQVNQNRDNEPGISHYLPLNTSSHNANEISYGNEYYSMSHSYNNHLDSLPRYMNSERKSKF